MNEVIFEPQLSNYEIFNGEMSTIDTSTENVLLYVLLFLTYLGLAVISTFFNVCVVYTAKKRFKGENAKMGESIKFAMSKFHLIFLWGVVSATVGVIFYALDAAARNSGNGGKILLGIIRWVAGMAWSILSLFVIPGMVYNDLSPFKAMKDSANKFTKTWGENLVLKIGIGLMQFLIMLLTAAIFIGIGYVMVAVLAVTMTAILYLVLVAVFVFLIEYLVFNVAKKIYNAALYEYADTGKAPNMFDQNVTPFNQALAPRRHSGTRI